MEKLIVSRHPAAIDFIRRTLPQFAKATVTAEVTAQDVRGKSVAGNLPLHLAAAAHDVWAVEFEGAPPRGAEYGLKEMQAAGARLARYAVTALAEEEPTPHETADLAGRAHYAISIQLDEAEHFIKVLQKTIT